jgi:hypothetical protein
LVNVYLSGNPVHDRALRAFAEGCSGKLIEGWKYEPSDIAVIFGVYKSKVPISFPRGEVFRQQRAKNLDVVVLETGYINRGDGEHHHYAAGFNGLNGRADFRNKGMPADRFEKLGVELMPWNQGEDVILCGQVPWDASVEGSNHVKWLHLIAQEIRRVTKRKIVFRPHPLAHVPTPHGCELSTGPLASDLKRAHCVVTYNSNSGVEAILSGVPAYAFDKGSMIHGICEMELENIEDPAKPDRQQWANELAYAQWTLEEMRTGETWKHLR